MLFIKIIDMYEMFHNGREIMMRIFSVLSSKKTNNKNSVMQMQSLWVNPSVECDKHFSVSGSQRRSAKGG